MATDIAARGIDISSVTHVVQYELPDVPEQYVHRIGRTARAGADGSAVAFCAEDERSLLRDIEKVTRQKVPSADRRNDPELAQLSANADIEAKRRGRAEPRGEPQPRRGRQPKRRPEQRGEHRQHEPRAESGNGAEGKPRHRRGRGGQGAGNGGGQSPGWAGAGAKSGRAPEKKPHRKGQRPAQAQGATRGDVMKVSAGHPTGPVMPAHQLMKHLATTNPWSKQD